MAAMAISSSSATVHIGCRKSVFVSNASSSVRSELAGLRRLDSVFNKGTRHCLFAQVQRNAQAVGNGCRGVVTMAGTGKVERRKKGLHVEMELRHKWKYQGTAWKEIKYECL